MNKLILLLFLSSSTFGQTSENGWLMSSNFNLPNLQFTGSTKEDQGGNLSIFNSAGAGINISFAQLEIDDNDDPVDAKNLVGFQFGFLFSANTNKSEVSNVFATTYALNVMDFQVGFGINHGDFNTDFKKAFVHVSYSIPISSFSKQTHYLLKNERVGTKLRKASKGLFF